MTPPERPASFRDVFAVSEYRAVYLAMMVSWVGDYLARAAITVLVYQRTDSVLLSAAAFAVSYLPWVVGGPLLSALAERYPYRRVMIACDLFRMALVLLLVIPGMPVPAILVVMFVITLANAPAQAARSALLPVLLDRRQLAVAMATNATTVQAAQVIGYVAGATLAAAVHPQLAISIDALTFAASAALITTGVRNRPPAVNESQRSHLLKETGAGFRLVFGNRVLRSIALLVFALGAFAIVPEGLAAAWAAEGSSDSVSRGIDQGMIMAAGPIGFVIGGLVVGRLVAADARQRLIRPFAILAPLALVPALAAPKAEVVALLTLISGVAQGGLMPTLNTHFVLALPHGFRARAFGVMQQGIQLSQGGAVLLTGVLAEHSKVPPVVGLWSVGGVVLMVVLAIRWPSARLMDREIERAEHGVPAIPAARGRRNARHTPQHVSGAAGRMDA
ncbi:MFS transporter [Jidongwangia harbinensis]|uniref:MFS transporter n=1 Tax=Jidongwangia harbinensis TaxID=2878561 RepID=UPI001CD9D3F3|nr:MFS transporter [Jidongwangia harbinensis]MCA2216751.1 MFS transporter [Jidongwangia harbinensis]